MAWGKKSDKQPAAAEGWGGGDDFWGAGAAMADTPPAAARPRPVEESLAVPPTAKRPLLEHLKPLFLYVCEQHRLARERGASGASYETVRQTVLAKIEAVERAARHDPVLRQHLDRLKEPVLWYLDYTFGSPDNSFPYRQTWNDNRLADYGPEGNLAGDEAFFDELEKELENDPGDESANERLAFYYTAMGLGFTGCYFKKNDDHRGKLRDYMQRIYPRVAKYVDADASGKVTPEAYRHTDKRDFVAPRRDRPVIFFAGVLLLLGCLMFAYLYWYMEKTGPLREAIERLPRAASGQASP